MERILCRVGLHVWTAWIDIQVSASNSTQCWPEIQSWRSRKCESCHHEQRRRP